MTKLEHIHEIVIHSYGNGSLVRASEESVSNWIIALLGNQSRGEDGIVIPLKAPDEMLAWLQSQLDLPFGSQIPEGLGWRLQYPAT